MWSGHVWAVGVSDREVEGRFASEQVFEAVEEEEAEAS